MGNWFRCRADTWSCFGLSPISGFVTRVSDLAFRPCWSILRPEIRTFVPFFALGPARLYALGELPPNGGMITQTFLLGLGMGGGCIAHCGSVLLPVLLCEQRRRWSLAGWFLLARLVGYGVFAIICTWIGSGLEWVGIRGPVFEFAVFVIMGVLLLNYAWQMRRDVECVGTCSPSNHKTGKFHEFKRNARRYALQTGFLTGISLCTPFVVILMEGIRRESFFGNVGVFLSFYLGTTLLLLPVLLGGVLSRGTVARQIGFLCSLLCGGLYLLQGSVGFFGVLYEK